MIQRISSGIVGLIAFLGMLLAGYLADNSFSTIILRAFVGLTVGAGIGYVCGYIAQGVVNEHVSRLFQADAAVVAVAAEEKDENIENKKLASSREDKQDKEYRQSGRRTSGQATDPAIAAKAAAAVFEEFRESAR